MTTVHDEEQILNDVEEAEESFLEVYIRFNADSDKDYCFQLKLTTTFKDLLNIFNMLPLALRPSVFYNRMPLGFKVSTSPGYLTEDGNFLFDANAEKIVKSVPQDEEVSKHCWPGQLILPIWEFNSFGYYAFVAFLLTWLYTDLPDFISPTPGICLTNQVAHAMIWALKYFGYTNLAVKLQRDLFEESSVTAQCFYFAFHLFKCFAIFVSLYFGIFNPIKLFRLTPGSVKLKITREELLSIGWTGTAKADINDYRDYYRDYKIKEHGGMVSAHRAGLFSKLGNLGTQLGEGEGYNTPIDQKLTLKDDLEGSKLVLNYEYFTQLGLTFAMYIQDKEGQELVDCIKQYRRYGLLHANKKLKDIVAHRKLLQPPSDNAQLILENERLERKAATQRWARGEFDKKPSDEAANPDKSIELEKVE